MSIIIVCTESHLILVTYKSVLQVLIVNNRTSVKNKVWTVLGQKSPKY